jgi:hypothetical protein
MCIRSRFSGLIVPSAKYGCPFFLFAATYLILFLICPEVNIDTFSASNWDISSLFQVLLRRRGMFESVLANQFVLYSSNMYIKGPIFMHRYQSGPVGIRTRDSRISSDVLKVRYSTWLSYGPIFLNSVYTSIFNV